MPKETKIKVAELEKLTYLTGSLRGACGPMAPSTMPASTMHLHKAARAYVDYFELLCAKYGMPAGRTTIMLDTGIISVRRPKPALKKAEE